MTTHDEKPSLALTVPDARRQFDVPVDLASHAERFLQAARAENTKRARRFDWAVFLDWCNSRGRSALPASSDTVFAFLTDMAAGVTVQARRPATLKRYLVTIATAHTGSGYPAPTHDARVRELAAGIRRELGVKQRQAAPLTVEVLTQVQPHCNVRDWAILCFGQATACRRSELCALELRHLAFEPRGVIVEIERSKTDQEGKGRHIGVPRLPGDPLCPVAALESWLAVLRRKNGPLFVARGSWDPIATKTLNDIVKRAVTAAGIDPSHYSAHSLRAGYVTDARRAGRSWEEIMRQTGHRKLETVEGYARYRPDPFGGQG